MNNDKDLIAAVSRLFRMIRRRPKENAAMTYTGSHVLHLVMEHDGIRTAELAERAGVRPASITDALRRLEKSGFVVREKDAVDSRVKRVYITDKTRAEIEVHTRFKHEQNARMLSCLTEEESALFLAVCEKLCAFLEQDENRK